MENSIRQAAQVHFETERAEGQKALAEAQAEVRLIKARADAEANRVIAQSLTPMLVRKMEIEAEASFAKDGTHTVFLGNGNATPIVNLK